MRDRIFELTDVVRETGYAIHCYHGPGHLEKVYENALVHRLRKRGLSVEQQKPLTVHDEDGTILGEYVADILIEGRLILEIKAAKAIIDDHIAQTLGYLRSARLEHGVIVNFGAPKFQIRKLVMSEALHQPERDGPPPLLALLFAFFCVLFGYSSPSVAAGPFEPALGLPVCNSGVRTCIIYLTHPYGQDFPRKDGIMPLAARRSSVQAGQFEVRDGRPVCDRETLFRLPLGEEGNSLPHQN
jgi:GxxExxY protein